MNLRQPDCRDCERSTSGDCGLHNRVVPAPGTAPLPAATVTVVPTCAQHPGALFDACGTCLRDARERAEKAEAERAAARRDVAEARMHRISFVDDTCILCGGDARDGKPCPGTRAEPDPGVLTAERDAARREAAAAQVRADEAHERARAYAAESDRAALDALLAAERERCARLAESEPEMPDMVLFLSSVPEVHARAAVRATRESIARRIRNPEGDGE